MSDEIKEKNLYIGEMMDKLPNDLLESLIRSWLKGKESASSLVSIIEIEIGKIAPHDDIRISSYNSLVLAMKLVKFAIEMVTNKEEENNE